MKFVIECVFDYDGYPDYYRGHGHAFISEDLLACIRWGFPINYGETQNEIVELILDDINTSWSIEFFNEAVDNQDLQDKINEYCTNERLKRAILNEFDEFQPDEFFFDIDDLYIIPEDHEGDYPMLIGYIHVYGVKSD